MVIGKAAVFITAHAGCVSRPSVLHGVPQEWHLNNRWAGHLMMPYAVWNFLYIS